MSKIAIIYWSSTGNTETMANLVAEGVGSDATVISVANISADDITGYDKIALGCPACGSEELDDGEFQPFYDAIKEKIGGKPLVLFGSNDFGNGEWMETWEEDARAASLNLIAPGVIANLDPDDEAKQACKDLGAKLAQA